jgi:hypothetical protein
MSGFCLVQKTEVNNIIMKSHRILRLLSLLGFLLLFAPFYDACNGKGMKDAAVEAPAIEEIAPLAETDSISNDNALIVNDTINEGNILIKNDTINNEIIIEPTFFEKGYEFIDDRNSYNAFELAYISIDLIKGLFESSFDKISIECKEGIAKRDFSGLALIIGYFCFAIITITTFIILVLSGFKWFKPIYKLTLVNLVCILIFFVCVSFLPFFETYSQIKWGYYAFAMSQILVLFLSRKLIKKSESISPD